MIGMGLWGAAKLNHFVISDNRATVLMAFRFQAATSAGSKNPSSVTAWGLGGARLSQVDMVEYPVFTQP